MRYLIALIPLVLVGCETTRTATSSPEIKDAIAREAAIAAQVSDRINFVGTELVYPQPHELIQYINNNAENWRQLDQYFNGGGE